MTFVEALRAARPLIESGQEKFICLALKYAGGGEHTYRIEEQLSPYATYDDWLCYNHWETYLRIGVKDLTQGRLQWIDHMIAQEAV